VEIATSFEDEFPNEPFANPSVGAASGSTGPFGGYVAPGNVFTGISVGGARDRYIEAESARARVSLPPLDVRKSGNDAFESAPIFEPWVEAPQGPPVDWDQVYTEFVILNPETEPTVFADVPVIAPDFNPKGTVSETDSRDPVAVISEEPVAFWDAVGDFFTTVAPVAAYDYGAGQGWWGGSPQPTAGIGMANPPPLTTPGYPSGPGAPGNMPTPSSNVVPIVQDQALCAVPASNPRYLRYNCATGQFSKVPRRRRRRLLTSSDLKDLAALKAIVGGGAKMDGAIVQAIRR